MIEYDVVVVGSGIAGSTTGLNLAKAGFRVAIIGKNENMAESNTYHAQGGIVYQGLHDNAELRAKDIHIAGAGICNPDAVDIIAQEGPGIVERELIAELGVPFNRAPSERLDLTEEGAHSMKRIIHVYDYTGRAIEESILKALNKDVKFATILNDYTALDIITWDHHSNDKLRMYKPPTSLGVYALNNKTRKVETILAKTVVIATGGMGQVYLHSTNPSCATGDGYAMAYRAGARLINMEYTQFHPTTLYHPKAHNFLISEAVRGEGAIICDRSGTPFMHKYHEQKDLAPRDVVTRAIMNEMQELGDKCVYLDLSPIGKDNIKTRFPHIYDTCRKLGLDISSDPIPIVPAFHFSCGGVQTNMVGGTNIKRLFAVGEVACTGLHGANRLASTSLLEGLVFGKRIADFMCQNREKIMDYDYPEIPDWIDTGKEEIIDTALIRQDWASLQNIMWNYVGAIRSKKRLARAISDLKNLRDEIEDFYRDTRVDKHIVELRNAVQTGLMVAYQAWTNRESIGAHYRVD